MTNINNLGPEDIDLDDNFDLDNELDLDDEVESSEVDELLGDSNNDSNEDQLTKQRKALAAMNKELRELKKENKELASKVKDTVIPKQEETSKNVNSVKKHILEEKLDSIQSEVEQMKMERESKEVINSYVRSNQITKEEFDRLSKSTRFKESFNKVMNEVKDTETRNILLTKFSEPLLNKLRKDNIGIAPVLPKPTSNASFSVKQPSRMDLIARGVIKNTEEYKEYLNKMKRK